MNLRALFVVIAAALISVDAVTIDHDQVRPFPQLQPVSDSEKAAVKFKPKLVVKHGCASYPAVNAAGETSGGLKGTNGNSGCEGSGFGSQVYGRADWYKDRWAIMFAWYFPKGYWDYYPFWRHDWSNVVLWIDDPALETSSILAVSMSISENKYSIDTKIEGGPTLVFEHDLTNMEAARLIKSDENFPSNHQPLIMWEQLTEGARAGLNGDSFGRTEVPMSDANFANHLEEACPF